MDTETKKMLDEILSAVKGLEVRVSTIEGGRSSDTGTASTKSGRKLSVKEFLLEKSPSGGVQTTLVMGQYLEMYEGMESFNKVDLEKAFRAAKEPVPSNINDKVNMCIKNGHMTEAAEKKDSMKAWYLTRSGEMVAEKGFQKENK